MKMNLVAIIGGGIIILAIILALILMSIQEPNKEIKNFQQIQTESDYRPLPKEWIMSGPFKIDRSQYAIGEKIFMIIEGLKSDEKGQMDIMRPLNATHQKVWDSIPFNGSQKSEFNFYFIPQMSKNSGICSVEDITGKWALIFRGTDYPDINFEFDTRVVPGTNIEPVC